MHPHHTPTPRPLTHLHIRSLSLTHIYISSLIHSLAHERATTATATTTTTAPTPPKTTLVRAHVHAHTHTNTAHTRLRHPPPSREIRRQLVDIQLQRHMLRRWRRGHRDREAAAPHPRALFRGDGDAQPPLALVRTSEVLRRCGSGCARATPYRHTHSSPGTPASLTLTTFSSSSS